MKPPKPVNMTSLKCPLNISLLLHCYVSPEPIENYGAPSKSEGISMLLEAGAIAVLEGQPKEMGLYRTTPLGRAWVEALCNVPPPKQVFVDEGGRVLKI